MFFTYIVANRKQGTLYTGHTEDLVFRVQQHIDEVFDGFSKQYQCKRLVWFELHETREGAFKRERQIKEWKRSWKIQMLEMLNPNWDDLYVGISVDDLYARERFYDQSLFDAASGDGPRLSSG